MAELSKVENRTQLRDRPLGRRTAILPERRNQQPVRTETSGSMRTARRGDVGGAEALLQISRKVNGAASDVQDYMNFKWHENEKELSQQGSVDVATGNVDDELLENASYNRAVRMGEVRQTLAGVLPKTKGAIKAAVNNQEGMTLEARLAQVDQVIDSTFAGTITDEEGNVVDFGSAEATVYAANKLSAVRAQAREDGYAQAQAQMDQESVANFADFAAEAMMDNEVIDMAAMEALLTPTADREQAKAAALGSIERLSLAQPEDAVPLLEKLITDADELGDKSLFDASDQVTLTAILENTTKARDRQRDQIRKQRYEENSEELFRLYDDGKLNESVISAAADEDRISQRFAHTLRNSLEGDQRRAEAEARARRSEARSAQAHAMAIAADRRDREMAWDLIAIKTGNSITSPAGISQLASGYEARGTPLSTSQISQLFTATQQGAAVRRDKPEYVRYSSQLAEDFNASGPFADTLSPEAKFQANLALETYDNYVNGPTPMPPALAYQKTIQEHGSNRAPQSLSDIEAEIERLENN